MKKIIKGKIKVVIVGCGRISKKHILSLIENYKHAEIVGLCDLNSKNIEICLNLIKEISKKKSISVTPKIFEDYKNFIEDIKNNKMHADLVVLATPSGLHPEQVKDAASVGLNVCTEKPMATKFKDGKEMIKACEKAKVHLFVVKQNRYNKTLQLVKRQVENNRFGQISLISVNVFWQRPQSYYNEEKWRGTSKLDGGALLNQASHYVDLLTWMIGPLKTISASKSTIGRSIEVENNAAIQMEWLNGAIGTMSVSMNVFPKNLEGSITILGEKGSVKVGGAAVNNIEIWEFSDKHPDDNEVEIANSLTPNKNTLGHVPYYENLFAFLRGEESTICDGYEGLKSLETIEAAYISSNQKKVIKLPLH